MNPDLMTVCLLLTFTVPIDSHTFIFEISVLLSWNFNPPIYNDSHHFVYQLHSLIAKFHSFIRKSMPPFSFAFNYQPSFIPSIYPIKIQFIPGNNSLNFVVIPHVPGSKP